MGGLQSGQMHQTVNLTSPTSVVRIHLLPPPKKAVKMSEKCSNLLLFLVFRQIKPKSNFSQSGLVPNF